jgi:outer membrane protein assembly factor BamB
MGDVLRRAQGWRGLLMLFSMLLLTGCGGGGGGLLMSVSISPKSIAADFYAREVYEFSAQLQVSGVDGPLVVVVGDPDSLLKDTVQVVPLGGDNYNLTFRTEDHLDPSRRQGKFQVRACGNSSCTRSYGSADLSYDFNIQAYPTPILNSLTPSSAPVGSNGIDVTVVGSRFVRSSVVQWADSPLPTQYISSTQLAVTLSPAQLGEARVVAVTVRNPAPGGGVSNSRDFSVTYPSPQLTAVSATEATAGCGRFQLRVAGQGFVPTSTVLWNGASRTTVVLSSTLLAADITAADVSVAGSATVAVRNPSPGGGTTAGQAFSVKTAATPTTDAVSFHINPQHTGWATTRCPVSFPSARSWRFTLSDDASYPLLADGKVYFVTRSSGQPLYALNALNGSIIWGPVATSESLAGSPAYDGGRVFVAGGSAIKAYNATNGNLAWQKPVSSGVLSGIAARAGALYFGSSGTPENRVEALDQTTGSSLWSRAVKGGYYSVPAVSADGVFLAYPCYSYRLTLADGGVAWQSGTSCGYEGAAVGATPVLLNDRLLAPREASYSGMVLELSAGVSLGGYLSDTIPAAAPGFRVTLQDQVLRAFNDNGSTRWNFQGNDGDRPVTAPIIVNNLVFVGTLKNRVWALDGRTGTPMWSGELGGAVYGPPEAGQAYATGLSVGGGRLVVPTAGGLAGFDLGGRE